MGVLKHAKLHDRADYKPLAGHITGNVAMPSRFLVGVSSNYEFRSSRGNVNPVNIH